MKCLRALKRKVLRFVLLLFCLVLARYLKWKLGRMEKKRAL